MKYRYRWIRVKLMGAVDENNVRKRTAEGWEPVPDSGLVNVPTEGAAAGWATAGVLEPHQPGEQGGLRLYRIPEEQAQQRDAYYAKISAEELSSSAAHYLRASHPKMPKFVGDQPLTPEPDGQEEKAAWIRNKVIADELEKESSQRAQLMQRMTNNEKLSYLEKKVELSNLKKSGRGQAGK